MTERHTRRLLTALALPYLALGVWAALDPTSMQAAIVNHDGRSTHLTHDYGAASLAAGVGLLIAARRPHIRPGALLVITTWSLLHAFSHAADLPAAKNSTQAAGQLALLCLSALAFAALTRSVTKLHSTAYRPPWP